MNDKRHDAIDACDGGDPAPLADQDTTIRVLVADARPLVRHGLCDLVRRLQPLITVAGEADSYERAVQMARSLRPHVVLLGVFGDALGLLAAVRRLAAPGMTRVLLLKGQRDIVGSAQLLRLGAAGVVMAEEPTEAIVRAILGAHGARAQGRAAPQRTGSSPARRRTPDALATLTLRERELIQVIVERPSAKYLAIADQLGISEHTVHNHLSRIYQKLKVVNRSDLLAYAVGCGLGGRLDLPGR